jgi:glycosyltransferase involved in cell wall biosynthesis
LGKITEKISACENGSMTRHIFIFLEIFGQEGGIQSYVRDVLKAYADWLSASADASAEIFLLRDRPDCNDLFAGDRLQFRYFASRAPILGRLNLAIALVSSLLRDRASHLYCGHINLAPMVRHLSQLMGVPYTILTYGKEVWQPLPPARRRALQGASTIWTISRYSRDRLCASNQVDPSRVAILPCIVDGDRFTPAPKSPDLLEKYNFEKATVLMTVARLWSEDIYKGVDVTLRALPKISTQFPLVKYLVVGRGDDRPRLEALARTLGIDDRVVFAGFVTTEDLAAHYHLADAYIMPSQEGFGIVYLEAMCCGVPVLSGNADGSADPLQDGRLGWRVAHRDSDAVAAACIEILSNLHHPDRDRRCNGKWLREQTLAAFSPLALRSRLGQLLEPKTSD